MGAILGTYSGRDMNFVINFPLTGAIQAQGVAGQGIAKVTVSKDVIQSKLEAGMDGAVIPSVIPGDQGKFVVEIWQTSTLQKKFLTAYNAVKAAEQNGDVTQWFGATILVTNTLDGSSHAGTGVGFQKTPDKAYDVQAGRVIWIFECADVTNQ